MNKQNMKIIYTLILTISFHQAFSHEPRFESAAIVSGISINLNQTENLLNNALVELSEGINPKSFNKAWKTEGAKWTENVKGANDVATLSAAYLTLSEQIKPKYFKPTWEKGKEKWVKQVKEARSNLALAGLLKSFYNNLTPEIFTKEWPSKGAQWVETLNKIE
jgi:hypothetical protein